jgi:hypothetical protein
VHRVIKGVVNKLKSKLTTKQILTYATQAFRMVYPLMGLSKQDQQRCKDALAVTDLLIEKKDEIFKAIDKFRKKPDFKSLLGTIYETVTTNRAKIIQVLKFFGADQRQVNICMQILDGLKTAGSLIKAYGPIIPLMKEAFVKKDYPKMAMLMVSGDLKQLADTGKQGPRNYNTLCNTLHMITQKLHIPENVYQAIKKYISLAQRIIQYKDNLIEITTAIKEGNKYKTAFALVHLLTSFNDAKGVLVFFGVNKQQSDEIITCIDIFKKLGPYFHTYGPTIIEAFQMFEKKEYKKAATLMLNKIAQQDTGLHTADSAKISQKSMTDAEDKVFKILAKANILPAWVIRTLKTAMHLLTSVAFHYAHLQYAFTNITHHTGPAIVKSLTKMIPNPKKIRAAAAMLGISAVKKTRLFFALQHWRVVTKWVKGNGTKLNFMQGLVDKKNYTALSLILMSQLKNNKKQAEGVASMLKLDKESAYDVQQSINMAHNAVINKTYIQKWFPAVNKNLDGSIQNILKLTGNANSVPAVLANAKVPQVAINAVAKRMEQL